MLGKKLTLKKVLKKTGYKKRKLYGARMKIKKENTFMIVTSREKDGDWETKLNVAKYSPSSVLKTLNKINKLK